MSNLRDLCFTMHYYYSRRWRRYEPPLTGLLSPRTGSITHSLSPPSPLSLHCQPGYHIPITRSISILQALAKTINQKSTKINPKNNNNYGSTVSVTRHTHSALTHHPPHPPTPRALGTPLSWPEAKHRADQVRSLGIQVSLLAVSSYDVFRSPLLLPSNSSRSGTSTVTANKAPSSGATRLGPLPTPSLGGELTRVD